MGDVSNPNLKPWVKERMRRDNDEVLAGKIAFTPRSSCWPAGVPGFFTYPVRPVYFLQTPKEVVIIYSGDEQVRHVYLDTAHSEHPTPSWYGESVGHYEGDTLVVDTIGQNSRTFVDNYRTPHSDKLHVVERYRIVNDGKNLEARVTMEDPAVFLQPIQVVHRWRRIQGTLIESTCAEGEIYNPFQQNVEPIPRADKLDF